MQWNSTAFSATFRIYWMDKLIMSADSANILQEPVKPFVATIEYRPITAKDKARLNQFGKQVRSPFFMEHIQNPEEKLQKRHTRGRRRRIKRKSRSRRPCDANQCERHHRCQRRRQHPFPVHKWSHKVGRLRSSHIRSISARTCKDGRAQQ